MTNARSIIEQAARKIHVLGRGQTLSAEEAQDGLTALNNMLGMFSIEGGTVYTQTREMFTLTGAQSYTVGSGGTFNTTPPVELMAVYVSNGGTDMSLMPLNAQSYADIEAKDVSGTASAYYYDNNRPLANLFLYPKPPSGDTITLYSKKPITSFANLTTDYTLPEGVEMMMVYNLAVMWAADYEKEASPTVKTVAMKSKNAVLGFNQRNNYPESKLDCALTGRGIGNIMGGYNV